MPWKEDERGKWLFILSKVSWHYWWKGEIDLLSYNAIAITVKQKIKANTMILRTEYIELVFGSQDIFMVLCASQRYTQLQNMVNC